MAAVLPFRVGQFARDIFLSGIKRFTDIPVEYVNPVKQYAAEGYTLGEIDNALAKGYITQQEYDDVIALRSLISSIPQEE